MKFQQRIDMKWTARKPEAKGHKEQPVKEELIVK